MLTPRERTALVLAIDRLGAELEDGRAEQPPGDPIDEDRLVAVIRQGLRRIVAALESGITDELAHQHTRTAIAAALDGSESVMRGELAIGNDHRLPALLPAFVFLVAVPLVDQARALELSKRYVQLLDGS